MEDSGGKVIAAHRMRMVGVSDQRVVMRVPYQPATRLTGQPTTSVSEYRWRVVRFFPRR